MARGKRGGRQPKQAAITVATIVRTAAMIRSTLANNLKFMRMFAPERLERGFSFNVLIS